MMKVITGWDFGKALLDAGVIPPNCGDVFIEVRVGGVVIIHTAIFADERILNIVGASLKSARITVEEKPEATAAERLRRLPKAFEEWRGMMWRNDPSEIDARSKAGEALEKELRELAGE
jgi:hypothetical protein